MTLPNHHPLHLRTDTNKGEGAVVGVGVIMGMGHGKVGEEEEVLHLVVGTHGRHHPPREEDGHGITMMTVAVAGHDSKG